MSDFADDCAFYVPRGAGPRGDRYVGKENVRAGLAKRFEGIPNVHYGDDQHWFLAIACVANGVIHPILSLAVAGYFPGLWSSPLVGILGVGLLRSMALATSASGRTYGVT